MTRPWRTDRARAALSMAILFCLPQVVAFADGLQEPKTLIELYESSDLVVRGTIDTVEMPVGEKAFIAGIQVMNRIKGDINEERLTAAQEIFFPSDKPVLREGVDGILFLNALPADSRWKELRSAGVGYLTVDREAGVREMDPVSLASTASFLRRYAELSGPGDGLMF